MWPNGRKASSGPAHMELACTAEGDTSLTYGRILVWLADAKESEAIEIACRVAAEHGGSRTALTVSRCR